MPKFSCTHCGQHIDAGPSWFGKSISCPNCKREIVVPDFSTSEAAEVAPGQAIPRMQSSAPPPTRPARAWINRVGVTFLMIVVAGVCIATLRYIRERIESAPAPSAAETLPASTPPSALTPPDGAPALPTPAADQTPVAEPAPALADAVVPAPPEASTPPPSATTAADEAARLLVRQMVDDGTNQYAAFDAAMMEAGVLRLAAPDQVRKMIDEKSLDSFLKNLVGIFELHRSRNQAFTEDYTARLAALEAPPGSLAEVYRVRGRQILAALSQRWLAEDEFIAATQNYAHYMQSTEAEWTHEADQYRFQNPAVEKPAVESLLEAKRLQKQSDAIGKKIDQLGNEPVEGGKAIMAE